MSSGWLSLLRPILPISAALSSHYCADRRAGWVSSFLGFQKRVLGNRAPQMRSASRDSPLDFATSSCYFGSLEVPEIREILAHDLRMLTGGFLAEGS